MVTGLLAYLMAKGEIDGALVVGMGKDRAHVSRGILATSREELIKSSKSKYCITPSMEVLQLLKKRKGRFAVVALPCQIHGLRKLEAVHPELTRKIAVILGLACNCNLNLNGPQEVLKVNRIDPRELSELQYRGGGWPGGFHVVNKNGTEKSLHTINIKNVMNVLFRLYGAKRCYLCVDAAAELADLSFADFWAFEYRGFYADLERSTLVFQRTARGADLIDAARRDNAVFMHELPEERASRRILKMCLGKKKRSLTQMSYYRRMGKPVPRYHFEMPSISPKMWLNHGLYHGWAALRGPRLRKLVLQVLFSKLGVMLDRVNIIRKEIFYVKDDN